MGGARSSGDYYDPVVLAAYYVSTGAFVHPTSRRQLEREECERLDAHLAQHCAPIKKTNERAARRVTHAFDHKHEYAASVASGTGGRLAERQEADAILRAIFAQRGDGGEASFGRPDPRTYTSASADVGNSDPSLAGPAVMYRVVDYDLMPGQLTRGWVPDAPATPAEEFPALPGGSSCFY